MAQLTVTPAQSEAQKTEWWYVCDYLKWRGFYDQVPVLKAIIDTTADSVTASWHTYGGQAKKAADVLDRFDGRGKETFKMMMNGAVKAGLLGGDYYAEIVGENDVENILPLPPGNIRVVIKNNMVKRYEELNGEAKWKPEEIFHLSFGRMPGELHGTSAVAPLNNVLIDIKQLLDTGSKIYELYIKPFYLMYAETDDQTELDSIRTELRKVLRSAQDNLILPKGTTELQRMGIPEGSILDPGKWYRVLLEEMMMSQRISELILGTGSVNSEESAKMQMAGFNGWVRWLQKNIEEQIRGQLFTKIFGNKIPRIRFSFAGEPQADRESRTLDKIKAIGALPPEAMPPQAKLLTVLKLLEDGGIIDEE